MKTRRAFGFVVALALGGAALLAANAHLVGNLQWSVSGNTVTASGKVAGLGNAYVGQPVEATADISFRVVCTNPGGNKAPGQQRHTATADGYGAVTNARNGNVRFSVQFDIEPPADASEWGCPNGNWTASVGQITGATLTSLSIGGTPIAF
jgi:hypothetical protein